MRATGTLVSLMLFWALPEQVEAQEPPLARAGVETNEAGQVVRDAEGRRIVLSREETIEPAVASGASLAATSEPAAALAQDAAQPSLALNPVWDMPIWGTSIGRTGMVPVDLDGDGRLEIVMSAAAGGFSGTSSWRVVRYNPVTREYDIVWTSPVYGAGITRLAVYAVGGAPKVFVGLGDGKLLVFAGDTPKLEKQVQVSTRPLYGILLADADNDGALELLVATESSLHLLDPQTLVQQSSIPQGARDVAVGNVDRDPHLEIVLVSGPVIDFDGAVANVEWNYSSFGAGAYLGLSDLDGDGMQEIVSARSWYYIDVFDADLRSPKYQIRSDLDIHALLLVDVTGDGRDEILYGDAQWGEIHAIDATTRMQLWQISNPEHGTTRIAVADTDSDGQLEVMWGGGFTSTGPDYFFVYGIQSRALEWKSMDLVGPFAAVAMGDADADGSDELVAISWESDSGYADGVVQVFDAHSFAPEWRSGTRLFGGYAWTGVHDVAIGDVDRDGSPEIVVATDRLYDGAIYVIDGKTHAIERQILRDDGAPIYTLALADMDGDGGLEIVAGAGRAHTGSPGTSVYVIDGVSGATEWQSVSLTTGWNAVSGIEVADLDGDGFPEIVAALDSIFVIDGAQRTLQKSALTGVVGFDVASADGRGIREIWAGTAAGYLVRMDAATLDYRVVSPVCNAAVNSVRLDRAASLSGSVQFACENGDLGIYGIFENAVLWRASGWVATGRYNNLQVTDRGEQALLVAGHASGVRAYQGWGTANTDVDSDGVLNHRDNCPEQPNPDQLDADADGVGDACNDAADADGDEWANGRDNCPALANPQQADADGNGVGDACNNGEDADGDEWADPLDNCAALANADQADRDGDVVGDACDPYPDNPDNYAARCEEAITNETLLGEALAICEARPYFVDADGDGEADSTDACANTSAGRPVDTAGCSQAQYCGSLSGSGMSAAVACLLGDWRNDEPGVVMPGDCAFKWPRRVGRTVTFDCAVAR